MRPSGLCSCSEKRSRIHCRRDQNRGQYWEILLICPKLASENGSSGSNTKTLMVSLILSFCLAPVDAHLRQRFVGPISSVTALGTTIVVLNSPEVAYELLDKRSLIYSSRPNLIFGNEMCGWGDLLATQSYNERFRSYRRPIHALVGTKAGVLRYNDLQEVEVHRFLLRVLNNPSKLLDHIRT